MNDRKATAHFMRYRTRDGRRDTWPHYNHGRYEVVDAGGFIALYFHREKNGPLPDDSVGFAAEDLLAVIKLLQKAYENRNWYLQPEYIEWKEKRKFRHKKMKA